MGILIQDISKNFGSFLAIDHVTLDIKSGSLVALLGPSGSGKSTLLRLIAGLEPPDKGEIYLTGENATKVRVQERNIGFVFQHYALFKHMTIRKNIAFPLEIRKVPQPQVRERVEQLLELVQLQGLGDRYPAQLSGGQRQRIALARALAVQPKVLLLDEPFGALDAKVRKELRAWLRQLHDEVHVTTVFVTHDQEEAMEVADQIVVMNNGRVEQVGTASEIYDQPASSFVMSFIGPVNVLPINSGLCKTPAHISPSDKIFLRPHDLLIKTEPEPDFMAAKVTRLVHLGWEIQVELALQSGAILTAQLSRERFDELQFEANQWVYVKAKETKIFPGILEYK
ncbi:TOBE-like domain-containing protein [Laspinema sp. A4]|uniref:sulfate/molybdate ABC transporter ATP-binding protein n=1 Tax=Laspinema sp. D2d TaxID=2953686 RepID=UPI0021BA8A9D|nr:TOBE-like domain-containing protein [Laspinema sp. D2d]MCT7983595.1 TOBE-like domain-containing protein [Laspinema sp. D2d]